MKDIGQYGLLKDYEWECFSWLPSPSPPFNIWVKPEDIAPFFFVQPPFCPGTFIKDLCAF